MPHREACRNKGKETCDGVATVMMDGVEYFDGENYCPGCGVRHLQNVLLKVHGLTAEDLAGVPLFADFTLLKDLEAGATLVQAETDSQVGRIKVPRGVMVITAAQERDGVMYRGEEVTVPVADDIDDEEVAADDGMTHQVALPGATGGAAQDGAGAGAAAGLGFDADAFVTDQVSVDAAAAAAADAEAAHAAATAADGGGAADEDVDEDDGGDGEAGPAGDTEKKRYVVKGTYFELPGGKGLAVHAWPTVRARARGVARLGLGLTRALACALRQAAAFTSRLRTAIKNTTRVERRRAARSNTAPPMPPMPDPMKMSSRSGRVGFACNAQAERLTESVTCDIADWESLVSMRWYLRHLNLLDTSKGQKRATNGGTTD